MKVASSPLLSAAMIVKNEERFLDACLRSAATLVDEIVVVDTGSTDRSREIALDHGARLIDFPWSGDFAAARNRALDESSGRFILYIDADERVVAGSRDELERLFGERGEPEVVAGTVLFRPKTGFTPFLEYRLFRRHPRLRFEGVIHETFLDGLARWRAEGKVRIVPTGVALDHLGYDGDISHKYPRDLPLLQSRLAMTPGHLYSWCHMASTYEGMGQDDDAEPAWRKAIEMVSSRPGYFGYDALPFIGLLALLRRRAAPLEEQSELLAETVRRFPDNPTVRWNQARHLLETGRYAAAAEIFEDLVSIDATTFCDPSLAHRIEIFGAWSWDSLAVCHFRRGHFAAAAAAWARAEQLEPANGAHRTRRLLAEARSRVE